MYEPFSNSRPIHLTCCRPMTHLTLYQQSASSQGPDSFLGPSDVKFQDFFLEKEEFRPNSRTQYLCLLSHFAPHISTASPFTRLQLSRRTVLVAELNEEINAFYLDLAS